MSDPVAAARSARESLARALSALQADPSVPPQLIAVAEPVSQAMGALFQIERSGGAASAATGPTALDAVRRALALLQQQASQHPAVQTALEAVAGSLGLVHGLAAAKPAAPAQPAPQPAVPQVQQAPVQHAPVAYAPVQQAAPVQHAPVQPARPAAAPHAYAATALASAPMAAAPQPVVAPAPAPGGALRVEAELGTHSSSNFYKGLSGNDVIEHGGLFVATYNIPRIGQSVAMKVSMPGGYEFEAMGVVRWTRETVDSSSGRDAAQPGFGAQLVQLSQEARQLVYRYVRNREPLFHDDL